MLLVACGLCVWRYPPRLPERYETRIGDHASVRLPDGSKVDLNTNTQLFAAVTERARTVTLERGEAYFEVAHDPKRPFVVLAGQRRIVDLATKFSVRRDGEQVQVAVREGSVRVERVAADSQVTPVIVNRDNLVIAKAADTVIVPKSATEISAQLAWRRGSLIFDGQTLSSAAEEFNRYNHKQLHVSPEAGRLRIGGSFDADNVDAFARLMAAGFDLTLESNGDDISLSR